MSRPKRKDKLVIMSITVDAPLKAIICQLAEERNMSRAQLGAELILLGLTLQTGKNISELEARRSGE